MDGLENAYFARWTTCIDWPGGVVEKFIGDAVMAVFGLSMSQEDDPESAVQAYQVTQARRCSFRGPTRGVEGIETRLIGRDTELAQLKAALLSVIEIRKTQVMTVFTERFRSQSPCTLTVLPPERLSPAVSAAYVPGDAVTCDAAAYGGIL